MEKFKVDILAITETKKKAQGVENLGPNNTLIFSGVDFERAKEGVGLLIHKRHENFNENWKCIHPNRM